MQMQAQYADCSGTIKMKNMLSIVSIILLVLTLGMFVHYSIATRDSAMKFFSKIALSTTVCVLILAAISITSVVIWRHRDKAACGTAVSM